MGLRGGGFVELLLVAGLSLAAIGCSSDERRPGPTVPAGNDDDGGSDGCIDADHDGFGRNCDLGKDCDDDDPEMTDDCWRCLQPAKDCPCQMGTTAMRCDPPDKQVDGGILVCSEGSRYCREGYWGDCEIIGDYLFVAQ